MSEKTKVEITEDLHCLLQKKNELLAEIKLFEQIKDNLSSETEIFYKSFDLSPTAKAHLDHEGKIIRVNNSFCSFTGFLKEEALKLHYFDILHPEDIPDCIKFLSEIHKHPNDTFFREKRYIHKNGNEIWGNVSFTPLYKNNRFIHIIAQIIDNNEKRQAMNAIVESEKKLKDLNATKDKFFSIIAHDLKNPFYQLLAFTELLIENFGDFSLPEIREYIVLLNKSAKDGYRLLENLLEWSRSQSGQKRYNPESLEISSLVKNNIELFKSTADSKNICIRLKTDRCVYSFADENMITTVLRNLISNAVKFTQHDGLIEIDAIENENFVTVAVKDNGIGISDVDKKKLFRIDIYYSKKGTDNECGTGIGLILCHEFINRNNGEIWVESEPGKGSTFYFTLPLHKEK